MQRHSMCFLDRLQDFQRIMISTSVISKLPPKQLDLFVSDYRLMRKTASEDKRIDVLRTAGCTEAVAKILLKEYGSIGEIVSVSPSELQTLPGIGKITATKILNCFISENPIVDEKIKMKRA